MPETAPHAEQPSRQTDWMDRYAIACIPVDRFHYQAFRYSTLADAVGQVKRDERTS